MSKKSNKMQNKEASKEALKMVAEKDFYLQCVKRTEEQTKTNLSEWSAATIEERISKLKSDYNKGETKIKQILCSESTKSVKEAA